MKTAARINTTKQTGSTFSFHIQYMFSSSWLPLFTPNTELTQLNLKADRSDLLWNQMHKDNLRSWTTPCKAFHFFFIFVGIKPTCMSDDVRSVLRVRGVEKLVQQSTSLYLMLEGKRSLAVCLILGVVVPTKRPWFGQLDLNDAIST